MPNFYLTVGVQYQEPGDHPQGLVGQGFVRIVAEDYDQARECAFKNYGTQWAFIYRTPPSEDDHPLGEQDVLYATPTVRSLTLLAEAFDLMLNQDLEDKVIDPEDPVFMKMRAFADSVLLP